MTDTSRRSAAFRLALRAYGAQLREDWRVSGPALVLPGIGMILVGYAPTLVVARIMAEFTGRARPAWQDLTPYLLAFGAVWLFGEVIWRFALHFLNRTDAWGMQKLYTRGMDELLKKDLAFFHDNFAGSLTKKVIAYAQSYEVVVDTLVFNVSANLIPLAFVGVVLWQYSPWLIVLLVAMVGVTAGAMFPLIRRRKTLVDVREEASNETAGHVADIITNADAVRLFAREPAEADTHRRNVDRWAKLALRSWDYNVRRVEVVASPMFVFTNLLGIVAAIAFSDGNAFSFEAVFVTFSYYSRFTQVVWEFNGIYRNLETHLSAAAQFTELLLEPPTVVDPIDPVPFAPRDAGVELRSVTFAYPKRADEPLFRGLDLSIRSGEKVGLVGRSGGGKSTLTRLLLRQMDVNDGSILVGGQDIVSVRQADLRSHIAYVPQDPVMFHRSLRDNIAFGRLDATDDEIRAAARAAHAAEFIDDLPDGYDTLVGERGIKLSGGQRQRLAIARALLREAPILLLDEATSSLDSESEGLIQHALRSLMEGRTAIVIAHRLSTVQALDRLVVLDRGVIVEDGTHAELVRAGGMYAGLWSRQSGGFLGDSPDDRVTRQVHSIKTA
jgi:ATP-binding cassette subfamily B protein